MAEPYRFIGKSTPRRDAREIVTGSITYLNDIKLPDMLYGKVLRSPHAHALIKNDRQATRPEGSRGQGRAHLGRCAGLEGGTPRYTRVLDRKVRYVGDAVALVAATTEETRHRGPGADRRGIRSAAGRLRHGGGLEARCPSALR